MDRGIVSNHEVCILIENAAKDKNIPVQQEILTFGMTDAAVLQYSCGGIKTGGISIPTRYIHTPNEMVNLEDLQNTINLICAICNKIM